MKTFCITYFFLLCIAGAYLAPMHAQESCYEQYLREHNKKILTAEDADDSYDELKKTVLAKQMYGDSYLLKVDTVAQRVMITKVDGTYIADVHLTLVDSTWYMWLSVDPLAGQNIQNSPYMYCNGNPIVMIDPDGRDEYVVNVDDGNVTVIKNTNADFISVSDTRGNIINQSDAYSYGTISCMTADEEYLMLSISNAIDAESIFVFCAQNIGVEWANCIGKDPFGEEMYIVGNTHTFDQNGIGLALGKLGFYLSQVDHSHTIGGSADVSDADHHNAVIREQKYPGIQHRIYLPFVGFFPYDSSTPVVWGSQLEDINVMGNHKK